MTIEMAPATPAPKTASAHESRNAKGGRDKEPSSGFGAILASVDGDAVDTASSSKSQTGDQSTDLPQGLATPADAVPTGTSVPVVDAATVAAALPADGQAAQAGSANPLSADAAMSEAGAGMAKTAAEPRSGVKPIDASNPDDLAPWGVGSDGKALGAKSTRLDRAEKAALSSGEMATSTQSTTQATSAGQAAKEHDAQFMASLEAMKAVQSTKEEVVTSMTQAVLPSSDRAGAHDKPGARTTGSDTALSVPVASANTAAPTVYAPTATGQVAASTDYQVAQQVTYWITQDVQNAELKLDGLGQSAVEVSISMSGNQAHVAFRTNEADTRSVLESSASHLRDMLQREGVQLSGMSVGTSGSGQSQQQGQGQSGGFGRRHSALIPVAAAGTQSLPTRSLGAGRSLDLFV